ncbi:sugar transferase [Micrococcus terreus]|uniref:sugar transferase n=1 Tax=Micrococcus terreus TaxID=574650 RepID=UPI00288351F9|nr:sugar transferase [Micrococcus terreus]
MMDYRIAKRGLDVIGSAAMLVAAAPVMGVTAALVARNLGRPVLFTQDRPGLNGKVFKLYKFRSMRDVDEAAGLVTDEERLTDFGRLLRSTSLDELPSLVNVLKGDMSFVGPRPLLVRYLDRYTAHQARRHEVRPGITGLAQVSGRNALRWEERFDLDVQYVDRISLTLDTRIVWRTISAVLRRSGISAEGEATMSEFNGSPLLIEH